MIAKHKGGDMRLWGKVFLMSVVSLALACVSAVVQAAVPDPDSVISESIAEADGATAQDANSGTGVKTAHIQDGAVTPDKLSFYSRVVIVAPSGGDFADPVAALAAISGATAANPYLVKLQPGVYTVASPVVMKSYVDLEGSGEGVTKIVGAINGASTGVVTTAANSELRFLTVENTGGVASATAIAGGHFSLHKVTAISAGGTADTYGIFSSGGAATTRKLSFVTARASGAANVTGVFSNSGIVDFAHVSGSASGGTNNKGVSISNPAGVRAVTEINATATGGALSHGLYLSGFTALADIAISGVSAAASGATNTYAAYATAAVLNIESANLVASGGTNNHGLYLAGASGVSIRNARIVAKDGTSYGLYNHSSSNAYVDHSAIAGGTTSVLTRWCSDTYLANTKVASASFAVIDVWGGGACGPATITCNDAYRSDYAPLSCGPAYPVLPY